MTLARRQLIVAVDENGFHVFTRHEHSHPKDGVAPRPCPRPSTSCLPQ
jgi:hypothetical protein